MSDKPAEVSAQQKAVVVLTTENPEITEDVMQAMEALEPGELAGAIASRPQSTKDVVLDAGTKPDPDPQPDPEPEPDPAKPEDPAPEPEADPAPEPEPENPKPDPEPDPAPDPEPDPAKPKEPDPEDDPEDPRPDPRKVRVILEKMTPLDKKVVLLMRQGMTAEKALAEAKAQLGLTDKPGDTKPAEPTEVTEAQRALDAADEELAKAVANFDEAAVREATKKVRAADRKLQEAERNAEAGKSHQKLVDASISRASSEWPEAGSLDTPLGELVYSRLSRIYADPTHALHGDPDAPFKVTEKAAQDLKIPGKSAKPAASTTTPAKTVATPAPTRNQPAKPVSGAARTVAKKAEPGADVLAKMRAEMGDDALVMDSALEASAARY